MNDPADKNTASFSIIFIYIALSVLVATISGEIIFQKNGSLLLYGLIWLVSFTSFSLLFRNKIRTSIYQIRQKMKKSIEWPLSIKILNGFCWAGPFLLSVTVPVIHEYLILAGIGFGNISTFLIFERYEKIVSIEQMIVGLACLISIGIIFGLYSGNIIEKRQGEFLARFLIAVSYAIGGIYAHIKSKNTLTTK